MRVKTYLGGVVLVAGLIVVAFFATTAASAVINHGQIVSEAPRRNVPVVLDGSVLAHAQVGNRIFVGGEFQQVQRPDGSVITQPHLFAYDINTGLLDENFRPVLNNSVIELQPGPNDDAVYVGGKFTNWDGAFLRRVAKLSPTGVRDTSFQGTASALVRSIAVTDDKIYLAGNFVEVNDTARVGFAALDRNTGALDTGFVANVQQTVLNNQYGRGIVATEDGNNVFGLHFGRQINGQSREAVVKLNVSGANSSIANWRIDWQGQTNNVDCQDDLRDIAISPNNNFIVIGGQGADRPPNCDSVLRYETGGTGDIPFTWSARMYSSVFSLAVSDVAVYAGGHFCAAPRNAAGPDGLTHDPAVGGTANGCDGGDLNSNINPHIRFPTEAVYRNQMAALNPFTGQAFAWDPGSNNGVGVFDLTLIDRGLLAGHDNNRFNNVNTGRSGFFDFGIPTDVTAPTITLDSPNDGVVIPSLSAIEGTAADDRGVTDVIVRLKNLTTDVWLQPNGTLAPLQANAAVTLTPTGLGTVDWAVNIGATLPPGEWQIRAFSRDQRFQVSGEIVSTFTIPGAEGCTVALDANNNPVISWNGFNNVANVQVRRDGSWISAGAAGSGTHIDTNVTVGSTYNYEIRWRPNGSNVDVACSPSSITIPTPQATDNTPPVVTFTSALNQAVGVTNLTGGVTDDISGVNRMRVRIRNLQTGNYWNGTSWQAAWTWVAPTLNGNTWTLPNVDFDLPGTYATLLYAWDNDGNLANWQGNPQPVITVTAAQANDTTPPVVTFTSGLNETVGLADLTGGVTDDISGVDRMRVRIRNLQTGEYWNGTSWQAAWTWVTPTLNGDDTWTLSNVDFDLPGTYATLLYAWDNEDNLATWQGNPQPRIVVQ